MGLGSLSAGIKVPLSSEAFHLIIWLIALGSQRPDSVGTPSLYTLGRQLHSKHCHLVFTFSKNSAPM